MPPNVWKAGDHVRAGKSIPSIAFTEKQGQYLAFIHAYTKLHRRPPAEADMQAYFGTTPPSVHRMVVELARKRLIIRRPGQPRSIELLVPPESLPILL
jgi:SOS-response transcriptional repressor LexA